MDQWRRASGKALLVAALRLSTTKPISEVSVAELCREASVTRDTFYRYAGRPIDVLATALDRDLPELSVSPPASEGGGVRNMDAAIRTFMDHVSRNRAIYRLASRPHLDSALRDVLQSRVEALLAEHARTHPEILPSITGQQPRPDEVAMLVTFTASGALGAVERWLATDDPVGVDRMIDVISAASAPWWFLSRGEAS